MASAGQETVRRDMGCVGYYVHHHGAGHLARFEAIAAASTIDLVPVSELAIEGGVRLPSDLPSFPASDPSAGGALHWAPLAPATATPRLKTLVDWLDEARPGAMVVDVSVETALTCRLAGIPTIIVRQHGDRTDPAHRLAYATAHRLIAPFPAQFDSSTDPDVKAKTNFVGFIAPLSAITPTAHDVQQVEVGPDDAVIIWGAGGGHLGGRHIDALAASVQGTVYCAGRHIWSDDDPPTAVNVLSLGWVASPGSLLTARPLTAASVGNNCVALVAAHRCPFIAVPQPRPFDEQLHLAASLAAAGVAVIAPDDPDPRGWADAVASAHCTSARWDSLASDGGGAQRAADIIEQAVER